MLVAPSVILVETAAVDLDEMRRLVLEGKYFFYTHALTEAKKDGIVPEDAIRTVLIGEVIEEYPERERVLIFAMLPHRIPLHVLCDYSQVNVLLIVTMYIPDDRLWIGFKVRKKVKRK
jgi:hypothetical protein